MEDFHQGFFFVYPDNGTFPFLITRSQTDMHVSAHASMLHRMADVRDFYRKLQRKSERNGTNDGTVQQSDLCQ